VLDERDNLVPVIAAYEVTARAFDEEQVLGGIVEAEKNKRAEESWVGSRAEGHDLDRDTRPRLHIKQALQLARHDCGTPDPAVEGLLPEDERHIGRLGLLKQVLLPFHAQVHETAGLLAAEVHLEKLECVVLGMQEARD
jgi:hypothetical protein